MKRRALVSLLVLAFALTGALAATQVVGLVDPAARVANGTGSAIDVAAASCAGKTVGVTVLTTAGSGTVTTYKVSVQGSIDGANFADVGCAVVVPSSLTAAANTQYVESAAAVLTSGLATGTCFFPFRYARGSWLIAGTTPSETFTVSLTCQQ